mmetsp:Transcript_14517/g.29499  ORF Transcript_14517/g.29499 Transcript_14517/m.29499 type:complete len:108 (+) Transcript_14517:75-398(+)
MQGLKESPYGDVRSQIQRSAASIYEVTVMLKGEPETVYVDPERGPRVRSMTENDVYTLTPMITGRAPGPGGLNGFARSFADMGITDQEIGIIVAAKKNKAQRIAWGG